MICFTNAQNTTYMHHSTYYTSTYYAVSPSYTTHSTAHYNIRRHTTLYYTTQHNTIQHTTPHHTAHMTSPAITALYISHYIPPQCTTSHHFPIASSYYSPPQNQKIIQPLATLSGAGRRRLHVAAPCAQLHTFLNKPRRTDVQYSTRTPKANMKMQAAANFKRLSSFQPAKNNNKHEDATSPPPPSPVPRTDTNPSMCMSYPLPRQNMTSYEEEGSSSPPAPSPLP